MLGESTFDAGAVTINFGEGPPNGPPLLLLHGGSARWQGFDGIIPDLIDRWHLFAPDFRGHGKSGRVSKRYRLQDYADDTVAFLRGRIGQPVYIFGHSLGGMIALLVAARAPELVRAVVVGDSPLAVDSWRDALEGSRDRLIAWRDLAGGRLSFDDLVEALKQAPVEVPGKSSPVPMREAYGEHDPVFVWLATNLVHNDPDMIGALVDDFDATAAGYDPEVVLPAVRCPVLLLRADPAFGSAMPDRDVTRALALLPQPTLIQLDGISHILYNEQKEPVLREIVTFLERVRLENGDA
jgi:pimeloyl-ACP methyl ester carboxylesterase